MNIDVIDRKVTLSMENHEAVSYHGKYIFLSIFLVKKGCSYVAIRWNCFRNVKELFLNTTADYMWNNPRSRD